MDQPPTWLSIGIAIGAILFLIAFKIIRSTGKTKVDDSELAQLRQDLRVKVLYNEQTIDRLIEMEREKAPKASVAQLMRNAIARWERDNR